VISTNFAGSGDFYQDIPIYEKATTEAEFKVMIGEALDNFDFFYEKQGNYCAAIANEKAEFNKQILELFV
jgi:hypothetical protein